MQYAANRVHTDVSQKARWALFAALPALAAFYLSHLLHARGIVAVDALRGEFLSSLLLFAAQDPLGGALTSATLYLAFLVPITSAAGTLEKTGRGAILALGGAAFAASVLIGVTAFHSFGLSLDEIMPEFQATIFREGLLLAPLNETTLALNKTLQPYFTYVDEARGLWASNYRPVHAALIAVAPRLGELSLLNPLMAALSLWAIADIARRLFPAERAAPVLAALLLIASPQFLISAGSGFSYPAHLAVNLVWLALFLRGTLLAHCAAALLGGLAIGLHQVHVHPLFVFPFLFGLLFGVYGPRWRLLIYITIYSAALLGWMAWHEIATWIQTGDASILPRSLLDLAYIQDYLRYNDRVVPFEADFTGYFLAANLLRFVLWICPAILILSAVALVAFPRLDPTVKMATLGVVLMVVVCHVLMPNQMQSWGARYYHPVLGNLVLLAVAGYAAVPSERRARLAGQALVAIAAGLLVLLPVRAMQVEAKVGPRAAVQAEIAAIDADIVMIPPMPIWFLPDLVRNDPFLQNRPLIAYGSETAPIEALGAKIRTLTPEDIWGFGLPRGSYYEPGP